MLTSYPMLRMRSFFFFQYHWVWTLITRLSMELIKIWSITKKNYLESARKKKKSVEAKYIIYGYFLALQYWAKSGLKICYLLWPPESTDAKLVI